MTTVTLPTTASRPAPRGSLDVALALGLAACLCGAACAGDTGATPADIASPAAAGSGQPFLAPAAGGVWMSWTEPVPSGHRVALSFFDGAAWGPPATIAEGDGFFVNWADFPSVQAFGDLLVAHWLWRGGKGTYDYGVRLAWSTDGGAGWSEPWTPHDDDTPTEHGFVSLFESRGEVWVAWLDGRAMVAPGGPMSVRARSLPVAGSVRVAGAPAGPLESASGETLIDERACECCQTDAAVADGVPVVVYRDRADGEVRDIFVSRLLESGWTDGAPVHNDGWVIGGCPVNGPAIASGGGQVAVAWFTAPDGEARVNVAFSADGAVSFGPPSRVDGGQPVGRVDVLTLDDGSALVTWLEQDAGGARILGRRVAPDGTTSEAVALASTDAARASGFPRIARLGREEIMLAWTDPAGESLVRVTVRSLDDWQLPS